MADAWIRFGFGRRPGSVALTKLDILSEHAELKICVDYRGEADPGQPGEREPIYEIMPGWQSDISGAPGTRCRRPVSPTSSASKNSSALRPACSASAPEDARLSLAIPRSLICFFDAAGEVELFVLHGGSLAQ